MQIRLALFLFAAATAVAAPLKTKNVLFVTTDGLRWQEVFRGAEQQFMNKANRPPHSPTPARVLTFSGAAGAKANS